MKHLVAIALLVAAGFMYSASYGPLFFGAPATGIALALAGVALEIIFWRRAKARAGTSPKVS